MAGDLKTRAKSVTFSIFDETAYTCRQFTVSVAALYIAGLAALAFLAVVGFVSWKCITLSGVKSVSTSLEARISRQHEKIAVQDRQLDLLGEKLSVLEKHLASLGKLEEEIHRIASIDKASIHDNVFGVGGSRQEAEAEDSAEESSGADEVKDEAGPIDKGQEPWLFRPTGKKRFALAVDHPNFIVNPITCTPFVLPVEGTVIGSSDEDATVIGEQVRRGIIAIKTDPGSEIAAPSNGVATYTGKVKPDGNTLIVDHGFGFITRYTNLEEVFVHEGDIIKKGDIIGVAGRNPTDLSEGLLYYEVLFNGIQIDPKQYFATHPFCSQAI